MLQYDARTGRYAGQTADGRTVQVDGDVFAEALADAIRDGMSPEQSESELLRVSNWQDLSPVDRGVEE